MLYVDRLELFGILCLVLENTKHNT